MEHKLLGVTQMTNNKHANMFAAKYTTGDKTYDYYFVSRNLVPKIQSKSDIIPCDCVRMLPYFKKGKDIFIVFIKEFKHVLNEFMYSLPAGIVENGEELAEAAKREMGEEIGAKTSNILCVAKTSYISEGISDETMACYEAEIELNGAQSLDFNEDIEAEIVSLKDLSSFLQSHNVSLISRLLAENFALKNK